MKELDYKKYPVLLVDDELGNLDNMLFAFELTFNIITASSGAEALEIMASQKIAVIVSDQRMPNMSGAELLSTVKEKHPQTVRMLITAYSDIDAAVMAINRGDIFRYIKKDKPISEIESHFKQAIEHFEVRDENIRLYDELNKGTLQTITALAKTLEAKDAYSFGHSERVAEYSVGIAECMGFSEVEKDLIRVSGLLHDIGKIAISDDILKKPGRLTKLEFDEIKRHPLESSKIIDPIPRLRAINKIVLSHHERCDGNGYPHGIAFGDPAHMINASDVSADFAKMAAWVMPVADTYDAMTSPRPYRDALSQQTALDELTSCKGSQFVPDVVDAFFNYYQQNKDNFTPFKHTIDYKKYPVLFISENREKIQKIRELLGKSFTIEIASKMDEAQEILARNKDIRLTLVVQTVSDLINQDMVKEIQANRFPLTRIALNCHESSNGGEWDELLNQCQVIKHAFNPNNPQVLKAEIRKGIEEAVSRTEQA